MLIMCGHEHKEGRDATVVNNGGSVVRNCGVSGENGISPKFRFMGNKTSVIRTRKNVLTFLLCINAFTCFVA
jgi:hypothetical protein